jgi:hypothetical protein
VTHSDSYVGAGLVTRRHVAQSGGVFFLCLRRISSGGQILAREMGAVILFGAAGEKTTSDVVTGFHN